MFTKQKPSRVTLLRFNRYVFLHRFYVVNKKSPYEVPVCCVHAV